MTSETPRPGAVLLAAAALERVEFDVLAATITIAASGTRLVFRGVRATNLLAPWDGARGSVEYVRVADVVAGELCLELRVRYATVPRNYRLVCKSVVRESARSGPVSRGSRRKSAGRPGRSRAGRPRSRP